MRDHERIEELIAVAALGGLDGDDEAALAAELAAHGPACPECRRLQADYGEVAGNLAFSLHPDPVPEGMQERVVGFATGSTAPLVAGSPREVRAAKRRTGAGMRLRPLVAVAASIVLFAGGLAIGAALSGGGDRDEVPADARVVAFEGEEGAGTLSVAFTPGQSGVYIVGADLPAPPAGQVYEVWMIEDDTPTPGPCLSPEADGSLFAFVDAELGATDTMAVTVEPGSCSTAPTTTPIFVADLTTA